jgi:hypothetical protein
MKIVKGESSTNMIVGEKPTSYVNDLRGNNSQPNQEKNEKKKQLELNQPNYQVRQATRA